MAKVMVQLGLDELIDLVNKKYGGNVVGKVGFNIFEDGKGMFDNGPVPKSLMFQFELME